MSEWQPIETAPRDEGRSILILCPDGVVRQGAWGFVECNDWDQQETWDFYLPAHDEFFAFNWDGPLSDVDAYWQPLPNPPEEER